MDANAKGESKNVVGRHGQKATPAKFKRRRLSLSGRQKRKLERDFELTKAINRGEVDCSVSVDRPA